MNPKPKLLFINSLLPTEKIYPWCGLSAFLLLFLLLSLPAEAYVGPGAGFAFLSSFLVFFLTFFLALFSLISWPFRLLLRLLRGQKAYKHSSVDRVIILGFDGMDPELAEKFMAEGKLPNFSRLKKEGTFSKLQTTTPAISPVAWSSFMTGVNPSKHNIFDFLSRNPKTYLPDLSSARIGPPRKYLSLGKYRLPLSRPEMHLLRKSQPFWKLLGQQGIFSTVLRVPITFPPEKFSGHLLSGMCLPDLKGSQGTFIFYTTNPERIQKREGGESHLVKKEGKVIRTFIVGPENSLLKKPEEIKIPLIIKLGAEPDRVSVEVSGQSLILEKNKFSPWVRLTFPAGLGLKVYGLTRFYLLSTEPHFELYLTPLNIDPEKPALPITHPFIYSAYLARLLGNFVTLGEANDTWALNEGVLPDEAFLDLAYSFHQDWEKIFFNSLKKTRHGLVTCVFETTDSIQHMFWRYLDRTHPAFLATGKMPNGHRVIEELYRKMDDLVGRVMAQMSPRDVLMIMSDHGFKPFRRGVNLNSWLYLNGYLALKEGAEESEEWFKQVDWNRTKAYGLGLAGIYLNLKGREAQGTVEPGEEAQSLKEELITRLSGLRDQEKNQVAINRVIDTARIYDGPYLDQAPDLIVGYNSGYRVSWDSVTGKVNRTLFEDNQKAWSADHCLDPNLVPGIFFTNLKLKVSNPSIMDVAPTVLELFGLKQPAYLDGHSLIKHEPESRLESKDGKRKKR